jgi:hypothetical protein
MIGVAEDDLGAQVLEIALGNPFDGALGSDRHERWCLDDAVRRAHLAAAGVAVAGKERKSELTGRGHNSYFTRADVILIS